MAQNAVNNQIGSSGTATTLGRLRNASGQWDSYADGTDTFGFYNYAGSPEGNIAADIGSICVDTTNGNLYVKKTDTVNTGWALGSNFYEASFRAYPSAMSAGVTGTGTPATVAFNTEEFDNGSNFASNTFTAPVSGVYIFNANLQLDAITGTTGSYLSLYVNSTTDYYMTQTDFTPGQEVGASAQYIVNGSQILELSAGDTVVVRILGTGQGADSTRVVGGNNVSWFCGSLLAPASGALTGVFQTVNNTSFTPTLLFGGGNTGMTGTYQGYYTRMNDIVFVDIYIALSAKGSSTGAATIALPVAIKNQANYFAVLSCEAGNMTGLVAGADPATSYNYITARGVFNTSVLNVQANGPTLATVTLQHGNFTDTSQLIISGYYRV